MNTDKSPSLKKNIWNSSNNTQAKNSPNNGHQQKLQENENNKHGSGNKKASKLFNYKAARQNKIKQIKLSKSAEKPEDT